MRSPNLDFRSGQNDSHRNSHKPRKKKGRFLFWGGLGAIILALGFLASMAMAYKFYATSKKVIESGQDPSFIQSMKDMVSQDKKNLRGENSGRINILLVGLAGKNYPGTNLTDSIIIASINPKTYQTALLSIPRDFYVPIPETKSYTKINALYARSEDSDASGTSGIKDLKHALSEITGQPIDYYIALDFDGFKQIISELGGVNIQVPKDIEDRRYPGPNYSYQTFEISEGLHNLDGETALKYARTRHDEDGDFGRAYRQQQILEASRSKAFSLGTILNIAKMSHLLEVLGEHLRTDIQLDEIGSFLDLIDKIDTHTTVNKVLDAGKPDSVLAVSHVFLGGVRAFILIPRTGDYDEIHDIAKNIFDLDVIARKQQEISKEKASVAILNSSGIRGFDRKLTSLLKKFGYEAGLASQKKIPNVNDTVVFDMTNGLKPFSLEDLSKKFNAQISAESDSRSKLIRDTVSNKKADFILVAGSDIADRLNYEENSVADLERGYDQQSIDEKGFIDLLKKGSSKKF